MSSPRFIRESVSACVSLDRTDTATDFALGPAGAAEPEEDVLVTVIRWSATEVDMIAGQLHLYLIPPESYPYTPATARLIQTISIDASTATVPAHGVEKVDISIPTGWALAALVTASAATPELTVNAIAEGGIVR